MDSDPPLSPCDSYSYDKDASSRIWYVINPYRAAIAEIGRPCRAPLAGRPYLPIPCALPIDHQWLFSKVPCSGKLLNTPSVHDVRYIYRVKPSGPT